MCATSRENMAGTFSVERNDSAVCAWARGATPMIAITMMNDFENFPMGLLFRT
jgi:hypothetical protein